MQTTQRLDLIAQAGTMSRAHEQSNKVTRSARHNGGHWKVLDPK